MHTRFDPTLLLLLALSCAHPREPDLELTAAQHRNEAKVHAAAAQAKRAEYEPDELRRAPRGITDPASGQTFDPSLQWNVRTYNPSAKHLYEADHELQQAAEHLRAARRLEAFEDARCRDIPPQQRSACPLLASWVTRVTETPLGVVLELKPGVDAVGTHRLLDCHLAYAIAQGFERPSCPLFVKGMLISLVLDGGTRSIAMTSDDSEVAEEIRRHARRIFHVEPLISRQSLDSAHDARPGHSPSPAETAVRP